MAAMGKAMGALVTSNMEKMDQASGTGSKVQSPTKNSMSNLFNRLQNEYDDGFGQNLRPIKISMQGSKFESKIGQDFLQDLFNDQKEKKKQQF